MDNNDSGGTDCFPDSNRPDINNISNSTAKLSPVWQRRQKLDEVVMG